MTEKQHLMRRIFYSIIFLASMSTSMHGQNPNYPMGISFKALFMDYQSQNGGAVDAIKDYHFGFEIGFHKKLQNNINLVIPFKFGNVNNGPLSDCIHKRVAGLDAQLQYQFYKPEAKVIPYLLGGIGGVLEFPGEFNVQAPIGFGLNFKAAENAFVNFQSEYRFSFSEGKNNLHHALGFIYLFGNKSEQVIEEKKEIKSEDLDSDADGIMDKLDLCPDLAGPKILSGCPDSDGDGVADFKDACPSVAGLKSLNGCPDSDDDGVADNDDECPNLAGTKSNKGCPEARDSDGDGIPDDKDKCPDMAGPGTSDGCPANDRDMDGISDAVDRCPDMKGTTETNGCPDSDKDGIADPDDKCPFAAGLKVYNGCPDTDGDGLDDSIDKCPNTPGTVAANGCPEIAVEDRKTLDVAMRAVQFDTGKASFKPESYTILKQIGNILSRYPDYNLSISGHTDNTGSAVANQELSEKRAKACYDYIVSQGVSASRLSWAGYGESRPVADNETLNGKSLNRRVEFTMIPK